MPNNFKKFWRGVRGPERARFARAAGCSVGFLNNLAAGNAACSPQMALSIVNAAGGALSLTDVCPGFDWAAAHRHLSAFSTPAS